jgi:hypothetical protein
MTLLVLAYSHRNSIFLERLSFVIDLTSNLQDFSERKFNHTSLLQCKSQCSLKVVISELISVLVLYEMKSTDDLSHITVVGNMLRISMATTASSL